MASPTGYSRAQIRLHWIVAGLIVLQFVLHESISDAFDMAMEGRQIAFNPLVAQHVAGGVLIGLLVLWRLVLRLRRGAPPPPENEHPLLKLAAHATHWTFYALMLMLPVSGAVAWFGLVEPAAETHEFLKAILMLLVLLHVAAALYHQFVLKTDVLMRMKKPQA
ncbi:cytochrome b/b6 domain-containing protein [Fluviibacterium sp. DFM31]|uniref:Cytochrome b/b6 domain-containing protein n=1 Tax=Meridianimarinicoccus marinus TaxID=3231483 RepID=A0ABV3L2F4_9RHOB